MVRWGKFNFVSEEAEQEAFEEFLSERRKDTTIPVDADIEEFVLSQRTYNALSKAGFRTVGDVLWCVYIFGDNWGNQVRNIGEKSKKETEDVLLNGTVPIAQAANRIEYLIKMLESNRQIFDIKVREEIIGYLKRFENE